MLPGRLCKAAGQTVQCCQGDCARLPGRLINAVGQSVQGCRGDCVMSNVVVYGHREM